MKNKEERRRVYDALRCCEELRMEIPFWIPTVLRDIRKALLSFACCDAGVMNYKAMILGETIMAVKIGRMAIPVA